METRPREIGAVVLAVFLLVGSVPAAAAPAAGTGATGERTAETTTRPLGPVADAQTGDRTIEAEQQFDLTPTRPGEVSIRLRYEFPEAVTALRTRVPAGATVTGTEGFVATDAGEYEWDGRTAAPTLRYRVRVNETFDAEGPIAGRGEALFTDTGDWALIRSPSVPTGWSYRSDGGRIGLDLTRTATGPAAFGDAMAYLGPHREATRTAADQEFRLVVPEAADPVASDAAIFRSVTGAADRLRVGARDERVVMFVAPTQGVRWGVRGLQTGPADLWVRDTEPASGPEDVWIHEYVHTRQAYRATGAARWVTEATATYYAALFSLEDERTTFDAFARRLSFGESSDAVLSDASTWGTVAPYTRGALVVGELDRRIRLATDGDRTLQDVVRRLNARGDIDGTAVVEAVGSVGGASIADRADRLATTRESVTMWDRSAHEASFEGRTPRIDATVTDLRVTGPYRTERTDDPVLAVGERLNATVRVRNDGTAAGPYTVQYRVGGSVVASATGTLAPGESATRELSWRPTTAGLYEISIADRRLTADVRPLAAPTVTAVDVAPTEPTVGESVTITAQVTNDATVPVDAPVPVTVDGTTVAEQRVTLRPGGTATFSLETRFERAGAHVVTVGDRNVTVDVAAEPMPTDTATATAPAAATGTASATGMGAAATDAAATATVTTTTPPEDGTATTADGPAPGPIATALAVVLAGLLLRRRR